MTNSGLRAVRSIVEQHDLVCFRDTDHANRKLSAFISSSQFLTEMQEAGVTVIGIERLKHLQSDLDKYYSGGSLRLSAEHANYGWDITGFVQNAFSKGIRIICSDPQDLKLSPDSISYALESTANGPFATPHTLALGRMVNQMFDFKDPVAEPVHLSISFQGLVSVHQVFDHLDAKFGRHRGSLEFNQKVYQIAAGYQSREPGKTIFFFGMGHCPAIEEAARLDGLRSIGINLVSNKGDISRLVKTFDDQIQDYYNNGIIPDREKNFFRNDITYCIGADLLIDNRKGDKLSLPAIPRRLSQSYHS